MLKQMLIKVDAGPGADEVADAAIQSVTAGLLVAQEAGMIRFPGGVATERELNLVLRAIVDAACAKMLELAPDKL